MSHVQLRDCAIAGVLYAEDFDHVLMEPSSARAGASSVSDAPSLLPPGFSLAELQAATLQAFEDGRDCERREQQESADRELAACLSRLRSQIAENGAKTEAIIEAGFLELARMSLMMVATALPALCARHAETELRALMRQLMPTLGRMVELRIRVHPSMRDRVEEGVDAAFDESGTSVVWIESDTMLPGDIVLTWQNGSAVRDTAATCRAIRDVVVGIFQTNPVDTLTGQTDGE